LGTILQRTEKLDCNRDVEIARRDYGGLERREQGGQSYDYDGSSMPVEKKLTAFGFPLALA
jgi:hypothetical protein